MTLSIEEQYAQVLSDAALADDRSLLRDAPQDRLRSAIRRLRVIRKSTDRELIGSLGDIDYAIRSLIEELKRFPSFADPTRNAWICFQSLGIQPQQGVSSITRTVLHPFRPRKLIIPRTIGVDFFIYGILIDGVDQLTLEEVSAEAFAPEFMQNEIAFDTVPVEGEIEILVQNISSEPVTFRAAMSGSMGVL